MDRTIWPTDRKLQELRLAGVVPHSKILTRLAAAVGLIAALLLGPKITLGCLSSWQKLWVVEFDMVILGQIFLKTLSLLVLGPALGLACWVTIVGFFQTRFHLRLANVTIDLSRLCRIRDGSILGFLWSCGRLALVSLLVTIVAAILARFMIEDGLNLLDNDQSFIVLWLGRLVTEILVLTLAAGFSLMALVWSANFWLFRYRHRMTEQEYIKEMESKSGSKIAGV